MKNRNEQPSAKQKAKQDMQNRNEQNNEGGAFYELGDDFYASSHVFEASEHYLDLIKKQNSLLEEL